MFRKERTKTNECKCEREIVNTFISIRKLTASNIRYATDKKIKKENGTFFMDFIQFPA